MAAESSAPLEVDENQVLRVILEGTAGEVGVPFFHALVRAVAQALRVHGAWVTEFTDDREHLRALAFWMGAAFVEDFSYRLAGTPCAEVIHDCRLVHVEEDVVERYPEDRDLREAGAVSYLSAPLEDTDGTVMGNLALIHTAALEADARTLTVFRIFAARAAAELRRLRAEERVRAREEELSLLVESAMDGILAFDGDLDLFRANRAATRILRRRRDELLSRGLRSFLRKDDRIKLRRLMAELESRAPEDRSVWVAGGLQASRGDGEVFPAEATLSAFQLEGKPRYTLILRDVNARREAERRLRNLSAETAYLREELEAAEGFGEIVGTSEPILRMLADIRRVADTDATVLILGETGTGKELVARGIHNASGRCSRSLVRVNCAAVPAALIESEFFGHEKGAFTGATARREGRFALADGGTIFLDEVGELPLELQTKLLRVLQEGEFEPVGSDRTRKVDVRIIAATNRDLGDAVSSGKFREDLYYRLNVFPIAVPPLRERNGDIALLAETFLERFARKMGRSLDPLTEVQKARLCAYSWPGNVRELQNVLERAVIVARGGRIDLTRVLPHEDLEAKGRSGAGGPTHASPFLRHPPSEILTDDEMKAFERHNLIRALEACDWRVAGDEGAARRLGLPPSTLSSRMRAMGIRRPTRRR
jgi:PAS domain S-box-containing protein